MKKSQFLWLAVIVPLFGVVGIASNSWGANPETGCWDEYNARGTRLYRTVAPKDVPLEDCTPAETCFDGYSAKDGRVNRLYVPHGADPATACEPPEDTTTTTAAPATTLPSGDNPGRFGLLGVGAELPSDEQCASWVRPMTENRPENVSYNSVAGIGSNSVYPRVTGAFTGTTDEIIQWTACKWGIDEDMVRAQINIESYWKQTALGDFTTTLNKCAPGHPIGTYPPQWGGDSEHVGECPESIGMGQVRWSGHKSAFDQNNAINSSAYNLDYTYAIWRTCFEGEFGWMNTVDGRGDYAAGDAEGCLGVWFSGRWYNERAVGYIERVMAALAARPWEQSWFPAAQPVDGPVTTLPATTLPATTVPATTLPATTVPATTLPATTLPATPPPAGGGAFVETFDGNTGLERFNTGVAHRDNFLGIGTEWQADHDLDCGSPLSSRTVSRDRPDQSFYLCRNHLMTSIGDTSGYSVGWFSPKQHFDGPTTVSWDVNMTDLGNRQWWEVMVAPADAPEEVCGLSVCNQSGVVFPYPADSVVVGNGPYGSMQPKFTVDDGETQRLGMQTTCGLDPEGCASKAIRRTWTMTDNRNGTITITFLDNVWTMPGSFPDGPWKVVFKDHNYRPTKNESPVGFSWHWDNIIVQ